MSAALGVRPSRLTGRLDLEAGRQTAVLYGAQLAASVVGSAFYGLLARRMARADFDVFALSVLYVLPNLGYLGELGVFSAGARLLAVAGSKREEREMLGALLAVAIALAVAFAVAVAAIAPLAGAVYLAGARDTLLVAAPFAVAVPLGQFVEVACQATNRVGLLSAYRVGSSVAGLAALGALAAFDRVSPAPAVAATLLAALATTGLACACLRPSFASVGPNARRLLAATREFGLPMYAGRVVSLAAARLDTLLVPYLAGIPDIGLYASAQKFTQPASSFARAMATTRFRAFAASERPSADVVRLNVALLTVASVGLATIGPRAYAVLYGDEYRGALAFLLPFTLVALFEGLLQPYNVFLSSNGRGRELRRIALAMTAANLVGLAVAVPAFGFAGAAWWAAVSAGLHFALHVHACRTPAELG